MSKSAAWKIVLRQSTFPDVDVPLWNEKQAAAYLGWSPKTLRNKRVAGSLNGIPFLKISSSVRYRRQDVIRFAEASLRSSTSDEAK